MRLSLIREATIYQVQRRIPIWANKYFNNDEQKALAQIPDIIAADPTKGKYSEWLIKQWKDGTARFPEDTEKLTKNLELFHQKKSKLQEKDISRYTPASLAKALDQEFGLTASERKSARKGELQLPPGAEVVVNKGNMTVVKITTPEASSILCSGTEWCVANEGTAYEYLEDGPLYLIYVDNKRKYLAHFESGQFMNVYDQEVDNNTKYKLIEILEPATGMSVYNTPHLAVDYAREVIKGRFPEGEAAIIQNLRHAYRYAREVIKGRWPELEAIIQKPIDAVNYAREVIKGRFPEGEAIIAQDPDAAYYYTRDVIKGRWPEGEAAIAQDSDTALHYAYQVIDGRFPEGEAAIAQDPDTAFNYAKDVIKGRWPQAEAIIIQDFNQQRLAPTAYRYAMDVIKGRWPELEAIIQIPIDAFYYARDVIKGRWPEREAIIAKHPKVAYFYATDVIKGRWPEGEAAIAKIPDYWEDYDAFHEQMYGHHIEDPRL